MGDPPRDLFASQINRKCSIYYSRGVIRCHSQGDAVLIPWSDHLNYAFPPLPLLPQVFYGKFVRTRCKLSSSLPTGPDNFGSQGLYSYCLNCQSSFSPFPISWPRGKTKSNIPTTPSQTVFFEWVLTLEWLCYEAVWSILTYSKKESTRTCYLAKSRHFSVLVQQRHIPRSIWYSSWTISFL